MPETAAVLTNEISGTPYIRLMQQDLWKVRQYFASQNIPTEEHFEDGSVTVQFPTMQPDAARRLMDGWRLSHEFPRIPREQRRRADEWSHAMMW